MVELLATERVGEIRQENNTRPRDGNISDTVLTEVPRITTREAPFDSLVSISQQSQPTLLVTHVPIAVMSVLLARSRLCQLSCRNTHVKYIDRAVAGSKSSG